MGMEVRRMPVLFVGHGSPMNAVSDNPYTQSLRDLGELLPRPDAVCVVSAHWLTWETRVSCQENLRQIYDFYGFPAELYGIKYEPAGNPERATRAVTLLGSSPESISCSAAWGNDHAAWTVLKHLYPRADVPLFLVSLDMDAPPSRHVEMARRLAPLRDEGVLILGSGNIVHNLSMADMTDMDAPPHPAGMEFDAVAKQALVKNDLDALIDFHRWGAAARFSVPTLDHYLPFLWVAALRETEDRVSFPCEIFQNHSVSMRSVLVGFHG